MGASAFAPTSELPTTIPIPLEPAPTNMGVESSWPLSIQHLALALNYTSSLLGDPTLVVLLIKSAFRPADHHGPNGVKIDDLFDNIMHSTLESVLCTHAVKEHHKALMIEFGTQETNRRLLVEECQC